MLLTLCTGGGVVSDCFITCKYDKHTHHTYSHGEWQETAVLPLSSVRKRIMTHTHIERSSYLSGSNRRLWPQLVSSSWRADPPLVSRCRSSSHPSSSASTNVLYNRTIYSYTGEDFSAILLRKYTIKSAHRRRRLYSDAHENEAPMRVCENTK